MVVENGSGCSKSSRNRITYTHGQWLNWYYWYLSDLANHCSFTKSHIYYSGLTLHSGFLTCKSQWSLKSILSTQKEPSFLSVRLGNNIPLWLLPLVFFFFSLKSAYLSLSSFSQCCSVRYKIIMLIIQIAFILVEKF